MTPTGLLVKSHPIFNYVFIPTTNVRHLTLQLNCTGIVGIEPVTPLYPNLGSQVSYTKPHDHPRYAVESLFRLDPPIRGGQ
ncbi:hypothetical protein FNV43_RR21638 [Rhamnella rubrinervis]|uniref:Uncharacterized protein n=1 Tax=Rhamnella rubrinervis TaxID=2594499 RepID=A0A8K0DUN1_9ROSA|nr:hypothetical protein FNV43_RR21638 [Rhamnella rubrinervis]